MWDTAFQAATRRRTNLALLGTALVALTACGGGGDGGEAASGSTQANGSFTPVAAMSSARFHPAAVVLGNGKVLVAGGMSNSSTLSSAELFDPGSGRWSAAPSMSRTRAGDFLVGLQDGRALALGSQGGEIYDPAANRWTAIAAPPSGAVFQPFLRLADGRVLSTTGSIGTVQIYDPVRDRWTVHGGFDGRRNFAMSPLPDGRVLLSGGDFSNSAAPVATALIFDPATGNWRQAANMQFARNLHFSFPLPDGRVVVSHGATASARRIGTSEVYDPVRDAWSLAGEVLKFDSATAGAALTPLDGGAVLVTGGATVSGGTILDQQSIEETNAEIFDPAALAWRRATPAGRGLTQPRYYHAATRLRDGTVLLVGGLDGGRPLTGAEKFAP